MERNVTGSLKMGVCGGEGTRSTKSMYVLTNQAGEIKKRTRVDLKVSKWSRLTWHCDGTS